MTFASRTFQGMSQGTPIPFTSTLSNTSITTGTRTANLVLNSDGTTSQTPAGGGSLVAGSPWFSPTPQTGAGASYWAKLVVNSNTNCTVTGATSSPVSLSSGSTWQFTNSATNVEGIGNGTLRIYSDAAGTNLVASAAVSWDVGYAP